MDPISTKPKSYSPETRTTAEARGTEEKAEQKGLKKSTGPTGNAVMDGVLAPATPTERASIAAFALRVLSAPPQDAASERKPIGHALIEKLTPKKTFGELLDDARRSSNPNATAGPIAARTTPATAGEAAMQKECKAVASVPGSIPLIGKAIEAEIVEACAPSPAPKPLGTLPGVPVVVDKSSSLPNTAAEGGDQPWPPLAK